MIGHNKTVVRDVEIVMEGPLMKAPKQKQRSSGQYSVGIRSALRQRWFTLDAAGHFDYYTDVSQKQHKGLVTIASNSTVRMLSRKEADSGKAFLVDSSESGIIVMEAATTELASSWVQAIESVIAGLQAGGAGGKEAEVAAEALAEQEAELRQLRKDILQLKEAHEQELAVQEQRHRDDSSATLEKLSEVELQLEREQRESADRQEELEQTKSELADATAAAEEASRELNATKQEVQLLRSAHGTSDDEVHALNEKLAEQKALNEELFVLFIHAHCMPVPRGHLLAGVLSHTVKSANDISPSLYFENN